MVLNLENRKILVLGGYGLVGMAVCRELLVRKPREIQIHSLRLQESQDAADELRPEAGSTALSVSEGNIFGLVEERSIRDRVRAEIRRLDDEGLSSFVLYDVLSKSRPDIVIDCVN